MNVQGFLNEKGAAGRTCGWIPSCTVTSVRFSERWRRPYCGYQDGFGMDVSNRGTPDTTSRPVLTVIMSTTADKRNQGQRKWRTRFNAFWNCQPGDSFLNLCSRCYIKQGVARASYLMDSCTKFGHLHKIRVTLRSGNWELWIRNWNSTSRIILILIRFILISWI